MVPLGNSELRPWPEEETLEDEDGVALGVDEVVVVVVEVVVEVVVVDVVVEVVVVDVVVVVVDVVVVEVVVVEVVVVVGLLEAWKNSPPTLAEDDGASTITYLPSRRPASTSS
jgi:hypothetical protein